MMISKRHVLNFVTLKVRCYSKKIKRNQILKRMKRSEWMKVLKAKILESIWFQLWALSKWLLKIKALSSLKWMLKWWRKEVLLSMLHVLGLWRQEKCCRIMNFFNLLFIRSNCSKRNHKWLEKELNLLSREST